jgi:hypothetical protein
VKVKKQRKKEQVIGVLGVKPGMGCTHVACSIANYLSSVEKRQVLYIEISKASGLLDFLWQHMIVYQGTIAYQYKGVLYVLSADLQEAQRLIKLHEGSVVLDFGGYQEESMELFSLCDRKLVLGSLQPWCKKAYEETINKMKNRKEDTRQMNFYCFALEERSAKAFAKQYLLAIENLSLLSNPFEMKEKDFVTVKQLIYGSCRKE